MLIVAVDDTDSRDRGMCTTYVGVSIAARLEAAGARVTRRLLIRLNPAVKHKTRGNAAVAVHAAGIDATDAFRIAAETVDSLAVTDDPRTSPGVVVADLPTASDTDAQSSMRRPPQAVADAIPAPVADFCRRAIRERLSVRAAVELIERHGFTHGAFGAGGADGELMPGRGRIGALAAVGAPAALDAWTIAHISYRELDRCGTPRSVDAESVFTAADAAYPVVWDTVDREAESVVCVPNAPGPILHGIRGDDPDACRTVAAAIESESVARAATFITNQGTDVHLAEGTLGALRDGACYRVSGVVASEPETKRGGHVHVDVTSPDETAVLRAVAFSPTGGFRDRIRALRPGDRVTLCGEHELRGPDPGADGTIKLEKFAVRDLITTTRETPTCHSCGRRLSSAGRNQGYRCRDCGTTAPEKVTVPLERELECGWYEVPRRARRHVAKPLVRGGFDAPTHPVR